MWLVMLATPGFSGASKPGARRKIHADIEHRQIVVLDEINARAAARLPVLDRQDRVRGLREREQRAARQEPVELIRHGVRLPAAQPAAGRRAAADRDRRR